jgi:hypothetical protein
MRSNQMSGGNTETRIDGISFQLGMINCFAEMVACGVKRMAVSPPLAPDDYACLEKMSRAIVEGFGIKSHLEKSLLVTDLQPAEFTGGKWSILYYEDDATLAAYLALKEKKRKLEEAGRYDERARKEVSTEFLRLLSYPDEKIQEILSRRKPAPPFMLYES